MRRLARALRSRGVMCLLSLLGLAISVHLATEPPGDWWRSAAVALWVAIVALWWGKP